jgi:predicted enzyme related to lactoylglutathione lyase
MAKATGIGGVFFRARDTAALGKWYETHLGVPGFWQQEAGPTVFAPFKADTDYFAADKQWMINLRVDDLEGLIEQLETAGIAVETRAEWDTPETGTFARIHDPEGNPIELWQPPD